MIDTLLKFSAYTVLVCCTFSCGRFELEESPWDKPSVPVVYSILSPKDTLKLYLGQSFSTITPQLKTPYPEARVYICGPDSVWNELTRLKTDTTVFVDSKHALVIENGKSYSLRIELKSRTIRAKTTVPTEKAKIIAASYKATAEFFGGLSGASYTGFLDINYVLPVNKNYVSVISSSTDASKDSYALVGNLYQISDFWVPTDSTMIDVEIKTLNPELYKLRLADEIIDSQSYNDVNAFIQAINSYGGTLPIYSNINGGIGIFSSYVSDRKRIAITPPSK